MRANPCKCGHQPVDQTFDGDGLEHTIVYVECPACGRHTERREGRGIEEGQAAVAASIADWNSGRVSDPTR